MNGQPWGEAHPKKEYIYYSCEEMAKVKTDGSLVLDINDTEKYYGGDIDQVKKFGVGCISTENAFLYGTFRFEYILPKGANIWPGIWLSAWDSWPPEIDIMEGWTGRGALIKGIPNYQYMLFLNRIHPGVIFNERNGEIGGYGLGNFGTSAFTYRWYQKMNDVNSCELLWYPDIIQFYYNNHLVGEVTDNYALTQLGKRMYVCLDLFVTDKFTQKNYDDYREKGRAFNILNFEYRE